MYQNYLKVALRLILKNKLFSFINIGGLSIGLTSAFLIILFVNSEMGYDQWIFDHERIYTLETASTPPGRAARMLAKTPREVRAAMEKDFSGIESFTRFYAGVAPVVIDNVPYPEKSFRIEETFFEIFNLPFINGDQRSALTHAGSAIISEKMASNFYPDNEAVGKIVSIGDNDYKVSGVLKDLPVKTHLDFEILLFDGPGALNNDFIDWTSARLYSYFKLNENNDIKSIIAGTNDFLDRNAFFAPESWQDYTPSEVMNFSYLKVADIHLYQQGQSPIRPAGSATLIYGFIAIASLIMVMASINFINLSTVTATTRSKEIAIHKVVGAKRSQLIIRYLLEAITLVTIACLISLVLCNLLAPFVFNWMGVEHFVVDAKFILLALGTSLVTGIFAGIYPAFHLSSKSPASAISGGRSQSKSVAHFRIGLIFFQYTLSIILVIASGHIYMQTRLATTMDLGFSDENIVSYWGLSGAPDAYAREALIDRVKQIPGVSSATLMAQMPGGGSQNNTTLWPQGSDTSSGSTRIQAVAASVDFDRTLEMELLGGRSFEAARDNDKMLAGKVTASPIVINELAMTALGFSSVDDAIGKTYRMQDYFSDHVNIEIIGVIKNSHFQSIHSEMVPMLFANADNFLNALVVKLNGNSAETLILIDEVWLNYVPDVAVYKTYLTDDLLSQYNMENRQTLVYGSFAGLAVIIAFMGIFGLAAYNVERRTKEVGIRKVFGASILDIVRLFVWQFSKPVMWSIIVAWPIAGLFINNWLENYAYRIDLMPLIFISAAASVVLISWLTIASHAARAAMVNPILSLRYE